MPIPVPNLDDLDWKQLTDEGRLLIPGSAPDWTNHNASDPGITTLELFAHMTEILNYRVNRVGDTHIRRFVSLLRGPGFKPGPVLSEDVHATVAQLGQVRRAVTSADYERLALSANATLHANETEQVSRAKCLPLRNLGPGGLGVDVEAPGQASVVVLPNHRGRPSKSLLHAVRRTLEPARLLATRIHVVPAVFVTFSVRLSLVPRANVHPTRLQEKAVAALELFFDPLHGGTSGEGWPFGRSIYVSEIYQVLGNVEGVDYVTRSRDPDSGEELDELLAGEPDLARLIRNEAGDLEAIALKPHELVALWIESNDITVLR